MRAILLVMLATLITSQVCLGSAQPFKDATSWQVNVTLASQIYLPTPRPIPDIYIISDNTTPNLVYRVERNETNDPSNLVKEVYATTNDTPHDTYKLTPHPLGPFSKGSDLGITLGQWISAIGNGTYVEEGDNATLSATFHKLVPLGTYSVWYVRLSMPPNYKYVYTPLGPSDGSRNDFKADINGNGTFNIKMNALPPSTNVTLADYAAMYVTKKVPITTNITWTLIAVAYHSDGKTHGDTPGELGKTTHFQLVHLMYPKPYHNYQEWKNASTAAIVAPAAQKQPGFMSILAITAFIVMIYLVRSRR